MLAKSIVALFIISLIMLTANLSPKGVGSLARDKNKELTLALMDKKIITWYVNHGGEVPEAANNNLAPELLDSMGARFLDLQDITYIKQTSNRFTLSVMLDNGSVLSSINSDKELLPVRREGL